MQMVMTTTFGFIQMYLPLGFYTPVDREGKPPNFWRNMVLIGEYTGLYTFLSLIPIMMGLALCSAYELSFNIQGFIAALATNLTECLQNVYSKLLISGEKYRYTPAELQFYTSIASVGVQIPACFIMMDLDKVHSSLDMTMMVFLFMNGIFFHFQSISAYVLMDYISPVTHSVLYLPS
nr:hypothetical protein BaRGS_005365 [Batillaria attramentaria]